MNARLPPLGLVRPYSGYEAQYQRLSGMYAKVQKQSFLSSCYRQTDARLGDGTGCAQDDHVHAVCTVWTAPSANTESCTESPCSRWAAQSGKAKGMDQEEGSLGQRDTEGVGSGPTTGGQHDLECGREGTPRQGRGWGGHGEGQVP